jgi:4-amino-4-deoxy-L-arabinose transferase-like glycosyltransferase
LNGGVTWLEETVWPNWKRWLPVALLLVAALVYRLWILMSLRGDPFIEPPILDSAAYDAWAVEIATKSFWGDRVFYQDPLYPYCLGIFYKIFGHHRFGATVIQAVVATGGLWMMYEAVRRMAGHGAGVVALALAAFHQTAAFYDVVLLKEWMGPFFVSAALLCLSLAVEKPRWWIGAGVALGLSALVRGNLLLLVPVVAGYLAVRKDWRAMGFVLLGAAGAIAPVTIRNAAVGREFVLTTSQAGPNLYIGNREGNWSGRYVPPPFVTGSPEFEAADFHREAERRSGRPMKPGEAGAFWRGAAFDEIAGHPGSFLAATGRRGLLLLNHAEVPDNFNLPFMGRYSIPLAIPGLGWAIVLAPLAAAGIYLAWLDKRKFVLPTLLLAGALVPVAFFFVFARYRLPALPVMWLLAGYGVMKWLDLRERGFVAVRRTAVAIAVVVCALGWIPLVKRDFSAAYRNLAMWNHDHGSAKAEVLAVENMFEQRPELWKDLASVAIAARAYERDGRRPDALAAWTRSAQSTNDPDAWAAVARIYGEMGDWARAAETYGRALPAYRVERGEALGRNNQWWEAVEVLKIAAQEQPGSIKPRLALARAYSSMGMWREVVDWATKALEIEKENGEAWRLREEARARIR